MISLRGLFVCVVSALLLASPAVVNNVNAQAYDDSNTNVTCDYGATMYGCQYISTYSADKSYQYDTGVHYSHQGTFSWSANNPSGAPSNFAVWECVKPGTSLAVYRGHIPANGSNSGVYSFFNTRLIVTNLRTSSAGSNTCWYVTGSKTSLAAIPYNPSGYGSMSVGSGSSSTACSNIYSSDYNTNRRRLLSMRGLLQTTGNRIHSG